MKTGELPPWTILGPSLGLPWTKPFRRADPNPQVMSRRPMIATTKSRNGTLPPPSLRYHQQQTIPIPLPLDLSCSDQFAVAFAPWRQRHCDSKKRQRGTWIRYEVRIRNPIPRLSALWSNRVTMPAMTASQMRIAETIDAFYGDAGAKDGVSRSYKQAVEDLDAETIKSLDGPYRYVSRQPFPLRLRLRLRLACARGC